MGNKQVKTLDSLTGLRFLAAFVVFIHHFSAESHFGWERIQWPLGAQAVSFFFVLSGFILTYVYHKRLKVGGVKKFYFTRLARIWPLHFVCFAIAILAFFLPALTRQPDMWKKSLAVLFLAQSWIPDKSWSFAVNGVSWSISTEMFFYLMFPLFLIGGQRKFWIKYVGLLVTVTGLGAAITWAFHAGYFPGIDYGKIGHTNPLFRLPEFCTGMAIGYIYLNRGKAQEAAQAIGNRSFFVDTVLELISFGAIIGYVMLLQHFHVVALLKEVTWGGPFLASWCLFIAGCPVFASVIYLFSKSKGLFSKIFSTKALVFLGEVSFAFYMIHNIVIRLVANYSTVYGDLSPVAIAICVFSISLACSIFLFKVIEIPCKSALLKFYDGEFKAGVGAFLKPSREFACSGLATVALLLLFVPVLTLASHEGVDESAPVIVASDSPAINQIIKDTDSELKDIRFGDEMELLGYNVVLNKGGWELQMVWRKLAETNMKRVVFVCDQDGNTVANRPRKKEAFLHASVGDVFLDTVVLQDQSLERGNFIEIAFHEKGSAPLKIDKGPRTRKARRLMLVSPPIYNEIALVKKAGFGVRLSNAETGTETRR